MTRRKRQRQLCPSRGVPKDTDATPRAAAAPPAGVDAPPPPTAAVGVCAHAESVRQHATRRQGRSTGGSGRRKKEKKSALGSGRVGGGGRSRAPLRHYVAPAGIDRRRPPPFDSIAWCDVGGGQARRYRRRLGRGRGSRRGRRYGRLPGVDHWRGAAVTAMTAMTAAVGLQRGAGSRAPPQ